MIGTHNGIRRCLIVALVSAALPLHAQSKRTMTPEELSRLTLGTPDAISTIRPSVSKPA